MAQKDDFLKRFGKHIQQFRKKKGLSIREAELESDITRQFLSDVENGKVNFGIYNLKKICDALDCEPEELFKGFKK